jgi:hypothetical protein
MATKRIIVRIRSLTRYNLDKLLTGARDMAVPPILEIGETFEVPGPQARWADWHEEDKAIVIKGYFVHPDDYEIIGAVIS